MTREHPITLSGPEVRAALDGSKTQARRVIKPQPGVVTAEQDGKILWQEHYIKPGGTQGVRDRLVVCPYGQPGDRLWVKEVWQAVHVSVDPETGYGEDVEAAPSIPKDNKDGWWSLVYKATDPVANESLDDRGFALRSPACMPRWASRLTLEVTDVRVERLQDISEEDARAEGCTHTGLRGLSADEIESAAEQFARQWNEHDGKRAPWASWESNPWVWVITFKVVPAEVRP